MKFIDELVEYFAVLLTEEQKKEIKRLWHPAQDTDDDDLDDRDDDHDDHDDEGSSEEYPYEEYDTLYDSPAKKGKSGHAAGKRRPLRHPAVSAEGLVSLFQKEVRKVWKSDCSLELYLSLAAAHDPAYLNGIRRTGNWRRFICAVECLKDLDADTLAGLLANLFKNHDQDLFSGIFESFASGTFSDLANRFCRQKISGVAAKAVLADLRDIAYPEEKPIPARTRSYISFLDNADLAAIFHYYRIQRKLEYILKQTVDEALQRIFKIYLPKQ
jgi:hypothetical protein